MPFLARRLFVVFAILAVLSLAIMVAGKLYGRALVRAGHTSSTQPVEIVIGNDTLSIPANMIRKAEQRHAGRANRVDLYIYWPAISGFRDDLAWEFNNIDPATNSIIFVSVMPRATTRDMAGRFDPVYREVMTGGPLAAGPGLLAHRLSAEHGYIGERLVYSAPDTRTGQRFVARCQDADAANVILAPCETDIHFGETLTAEIRFPARLLKDWHGLQAALPAYLRGLLADRGG
ncbi:MAG: hypothetical protein Kow0026_17170 [Oricola sp.]